MRQLRLKGLSKGKLVTHSNQVAETRAIDRRAIELMEAGACAGWDDAYSQAFSCHSAKRT